MDSRKPGDRPWPQPDDHRQENGKLQVYNPRGTTSWTSEDDVINGDLESAADDRCSEAHHGDVNRVYIQQGWTHRANAKRCACRGRFGRRPRHPFGSGDGAQFFDFKARAAGRTTAKLLFCPHGLCGSAAEVSASPVPTATHTAAPTKSDDQVAYYVYTITVR
ncbi:hypothetical protein [Streptomyces sp. NPDC056721]|uniref:hypothetical protein n=1 Tax=unclassified Streptomyces TaxID=2593676 RepID=UPI003693F059